MKTRYFRHSLLGVFLLCFTVITQAQTYCTPGVNVRDPDNSAKWMRFNDTSGFYIYCDTIYRDYVDYFDTLKACVSPGQNYILEIKCKNKWKSAVCIWVDWNRDGVFDNNTGSNEKVDSALRLMPDSLYPANIPVPSGLAAGNYRIRVLVDDYADYYNGLATFTPCKAGNAAIGWTAWGQYLDFNLSVKDSKTDLALNGIIDPVILNPGNNSVKVSLFNNSYEYIDSFRLSYSFNHATPVVEKINGWSFRCETEKQYSFLSNLNISSGLHGKLQTWVKYPNGADPDSNINNDTAEIYLCSALNGNYTIDPSIPSAARNFASFTDLARALNNCGVSGAVNINVSSGTYQESFVLNNVSGLSAQNVLTIHGNQAILESSDTYTLELSGISHVDISNLKIINSSPNTSVPAHITNGSSYISFDSCSMIADSLQAYSAGVLIGSNSWTADSKQHGNYISVSNSTIVSGVYGLLCLGSNISNATGIDIRSNVIRTSYGSGLYFEYESDAVVKNNIVKSGGIMDMNGSDNTYSENKLNLTYGIEVFFGDGQKIYNNSIFGNPLIYGLYAFVSGNINFYHNTIYSGDQYTTGIYESGCTGLDLRNNIIHLTGSNAQALYIKASSVSNCNYNNLYCPNNNNPIYIDQLFTKIPQVKGYAGLNKVLYNQPANLMSFSNNAPDLHLNTAFAGLPGDTSLGIDKDIDGELRCAIGPSLGCDESKFVLQPPVSGFSVNDTVYRSAPFTVINNHSISDNLLFYWGVDNQYNYSTNVNFTTIISTSGTHQIHLISRNCAGADTITKSVVVVLPSTTPNPQFLASSSTLDQGDFVHFFNQTSGGDTAWEWSVTQGVNGVDYQFVNGTGHFDYEGDIQFNTPGKYEVCLSAYNIVGGSSICKKGYIDVLPFVNMCQTQRSNAVKGRFYDDGGKRGNCSFSGNGICKLIIDPCNGPVTLNFSSFNLSVFSNLRIYDGQDAATGIPFHSSNGFTGSTNPSSMTAQSGKIYIEWEYNYAYPTTGWEAEWTTSGGNYAKPVARFGGIPQTIYTGTKHTATPIGLKLGQTAEWILDGNYQGALASMNIFYNSPGNHTLCLIVSDCGGKDTLCTSFSVVNPTTAPIADFSVTYPNNLKSCNVDSASYLYVAAGDTLTATDLSAQGPTSWKWTGSSKHIIFLNGDSSAQVSFTVDSAGFYGLSLFAKNIIGSNSVTKSNIIYSSPEYCAPTAQYLNSDIGINEVVINGVHYRSDAGNSGYENFSSEKSFCLSAGGNYPFSVSRPTAINQVNTAIYLDINRNGNFEPGERLTFVQSLAGNLWADTLHVPSGISLGKTKLRVGTSFFSNNLTACGPILFGEYEDYAVFIVPDNEKPHVTIIGSSPDFIASGKQYSDPGATAYDDVDGAVPVVSVGNVISNIFLDSFAIKYAATDQSGNTSDTVVRMVRVIPDVVPPIMSLVADSIYYHDAGIPFVDPGATAYDSVYGAINNINVSGTVDYNTFGTYILTYSACDYKGNCASIRRKVIVGDTTRPVLYLSGANPFVLMVGDSFADPGVSNIVDNYSQNLTYKVSGYLNNLVLGNYTLTYSSTDSFGNTGIVTRQIIVKDTVSPEIALSGGDTIIVEARKGMLFNDPGYSATDNYFAKIKVSVSGNVYIDKLHLGQHQLLTYRAEDISGNVSQKTRVVIVQKTAKPWGILVGSSTEAFALDSFKTYNDLGVNKYDDFFNDSDLTVTRTGSVNFAKTGVYELTYQITDAVGNNALTPLKRFVVIYTPAGVPVEADNLNIIDAYPNPTSDVIIISCKEKLSHLQISDLAGRLIKVTIPNESTRFELDLSGLSNGVYMLSGMMGDKTFTKSIVVSK